MDRAQKIKWIKALRSGEYKQDINALKTQDGFCCLGVAKEIGLCRARRSSTQNYVSTSFLPMETQKTLSRFNDWSMWSFKRIATWIEKNL